MTVRDENLSGESIQQRELRKARALEGAATPADDAAPRFTPIDAEAGASADTQQYINQMRAKAAVNEYLVRNQTQITRDLRKFLGEAAPYLDDDVTVEITRNPDGRVWIKHLGGVERPLTTQQRFRDASRLCQEIAASGGLDFTPDEPHLEYIVPFHGARFTATMMPIISGVMWRIRKRIAETLYLEDYRNNDQISEPLYKRLLTLIRQNKNLLIVGVQGTGKTTCANAILNTVSTIYPSTRFGILEDTPEIQCVAANRYEMLTCNRLGYTFGRLIPMQLRYGAHSLSIGEIREAALATLEAWRTGTTRTGIATIHGVDEAEGIGRIEEILIKERYEVNPQTIRKAVGGIVVLKPVENGLPRITNVTWIKDVAGKDYLFEPPPRIRTSRGSHAA